MKEVKIDEKIYLMLEEIFTSEDFLKGVPQTIAEKKRLEIAGYFLQKQMKRWKRENRVEDYYRDKWIEEAAAAAFAIRTAKEEFSPAGANDGV